MYVVRFHNFTINNSEQVPIIGRKFENIKPYQKRGNIFDTYSGTNYKNKL